MFGWQRNVKEHIFQIYGGDSVMLVYTVDHTFSGGKKSGGRLPVDKFGGGQIGTKSGAFVSTLSLRLTHSAGPGSGAGSSASASATVGKERAQLFLVLLRRRETLSYSFHCCTQQPRRGEGGVKERDTLAVREVGTDDVALPPRSPLSSLEPGP